MERRPLEELAHASPQKPPFQPGSGQKQIHDLLKGRVVEVRNLNPWERNFWGRKKRKAERLEKCSAWSG